MDADAKAKLRYFSALAALGWFLLNFVWLFFFGLMPVYSLHPIPWSQCLVYLTGIPLALTFFKNFPFSLLPLLFTILGCWVWFRKPNIISGTLLIGCGASWSLSTLSFRHFLGPAMAALAFAGLLVLAWILQRIWNSWDAPEASPEEKAARSLACKKKWPLRKRIALLLLPLFLYCASSSLCALGGSYRTMIASLTNEEVFWRDFDGTYYKSGKKIWYHKHIPKAEDLSMAGLIKYTSLNHEFLPALLGKIPTSFYSLKNSFLSMHRFGFVTIFFLLYLIWFFRPSWLGYFVLTTLFLLGVADAKSNLVWQFTVPLRDHPGLVEKVPAFLYFWATKLPI